MKYKGSIKKRLILIMMSVSILTIVIGYASFVYSNVQNQYERTFNLAKTVSFVLGQDFAKLLLLKDLSSASDISSSLKPFENLESMVLYNLDEKPVLKYHKENKNFDVSTLPKKDKRAFFIEENILTLYSDAKYEGNQLGYTQYKFKIDTTYELFIKNISALILILILMFVMSYLLTIYYARVFTQPITSLVSFLEKINLTDSLNTKIHTKEKNEYGKLYDEVNMMLERLKSSHDAMKIAAVAFETQNAVMLVDKKQNILKVNKAFTNITGYEADEVIGFTPKIFQSGLHGKEFYDELNESLRQKKFWSGDINNKHKNGTILNEYLTINTVLDDEGNTMYYVASFVDKTLLKMTEAKLKEKEELLVEQSKMAVMGEMMENIIHQWRQHLSLITAITSTISVKKELGLHLDIEEDKRDLEKINMTIQYLTETINDFRNFYNPNKEKIEFSVENCYKKVLNLEKSNFKRSNVEFIESIEDITICDIENELIQVLINILNNAKDALDESKYDRKLIFINIYEEEKNAILTIKDNAGGIPKEIINKVFEFHFTTKGDNKGTGIGLFISKEIICKHMNGMISVKNINFSYENKEYTGAEFKLSIPLKTSI